MKFALPLPPSTNQLTATIPGPRGPIRIKTREYKKWIKAAGVNIMLQRMHQLPVPQPPIRLIYCVPDTQGKRDIGNYEKPLTDLLVKMNIIPQDNDSVVKEITIRWQPDLKQVVAYVETWVP